MATRARIGIEQADGTILTAYQHWDGYPGGLGYKLCEHWTNPEKVQKAIELGNASTWNQIIGEKCDFDDRNAESHDVQNIYYGRDRGEQDQGPITYKNQSEYLQEGFHSGEEYIYLLKDQGKKDFMGKSQGEWYYATRVWNTTEKDYDPAKGFEPLEAVAILDHIESLRRYLRSLSTNKRTAA